MTFIPEYPVEALRQATKRVTREVGAKPRPWPRCLWCQEVRGLAALLRSEEQSFFGQALIHGNVSLAVAQGLLQTLEALPFRGALTQGVAGGLLRSRFTQLPAGQDVLQVQPEPNAEETNHAVVCVFWTGDEVLDGLTSNLLERVMKAGASRHRTKRSRGRRPSTIGSVRNSSWVARQSP